MQLMMAIYAMVIGAIIVLAVHLAEGQGTRIKHIAWLSLPLWGMLANGYISCWIGLDLIMSLAVVASLILGARPIYYATNIKKPQE